MADSIKSGMHVFFPLSRGVLPGYSHRVRRRPTACLDSQVYSSWRDSRPSSGGDISAVWCYSLGLIYGLPNQHSLV